jgi:uncharacterized DUF497 family protein
MKPFDWNEQKNKLLKQTRGIGFENIVNAINDGHLLAVLDHPNNAKYPNQKVYIVAIEDYACAVPFVDNKDTLFLKTIYRSRKYTNLYLKAKD